MGSFDLAFELKSLRIMKPKETSNINYLVVLNLMVELVFACGSRASSGNIQSNATQASSIYDFNATDIDGNEVSLSKYANHVCIIVNVVSKSPELMRKSKLLLQPKVWNSAKDLISLLKSTSMAKTHTHFGTT